MEIQNLLESCSSILVKLALCVVFAGAWGELGDPGDWVGSLPSAQVVSFTGAEEILLDVCSHLHASRM